MSDISGFITALEAAQKKEKFTAEVQDAAAGIDIAALKAAVEAGLAMGETETIDDEAQKTALQKGFEFATKVVMMLKTAPGPFEKKDLYVNFKVAKGEVLEKPGMFDMVVCSWLWSCLPCLLFVAVWTLLLIWFRSVVIEEAALRRLGGCQALLPPEGSGPLHQAC